MGATHQRIREESRKEKQTWRSLTIAIDFDGVLHRYSKGWGDGSIYDQAIPGAARALKRMRLEGHRVVIFSTRAYPFHPFTGERQESQVPEMEQWLKENGIQFDEIWTRPFKPAADVFIDDRAYRFPVPGLLSQIRSRIADPWCAMEAVLEGDEVLHPETEYWPELY